jgi:hypothetical protein
MMDKTVAAAVFVLCVAALLRMLLRPQQRARLDRALQRSWWWCRDAAQRLMHRRRVRSADAQRQAREAIDRAARKNKLH